MDSTSASKEDASFDPFLDADEDGFEFASRRTPRGEPRKKHPGCAHSRNGWRRKVMGRR